MQGEGVSRHHDRLAIDYPSLGYEIAVLPRAGVAERADVVLASVGD